MATQPPPPPSLKWTTAQVLIAVAALIGLVFIILDAPGVLALDRSASITDAIFLAVSATTLTGLSVSDVSRQLSPLGFGVLAIVIQLAGWFWMTTASWLVFRVLTRFDDTARPPTWGWLLRRIATISLVVQAIATLAMIPLWRGEIDFLQRVGLSAFHAIAAWNNAGFSPLPDKLADYRDSPLVYFIIAPLSVAGMIGYPGWYLLGRGVSGFFDHWHDDKPKTEVPAVLQNTRHVFGGEHAVKPPDRTKPDPATAIATPQWLRFATRHWAPAMLSALALTFIIGGVAIAISQDMPRHYQSLKLGMEMTGRLSQEDKAVARRRDDAAAAYLAASARSSGLSATPTESLLTASRFATMCLMLLGGFPGGSADGMSVVLIAVLIRFRPAPLEGRTRHSTAEALAWILAWAPFFLILLPTRWNLSTAWLWMSGVVLLSLFVAQEIVSRRAELQRAKAEAEGTQEFVKDGARETELRQQDNYIRGAIKPWQRWATQCGVLFLLLIVLGIYLLTLSEPYPFLDLAFEAVSAASNSGLSLTPHGGLAGDMTTMGRWVLIGLMVLGRVGPLVLLTSVAARREE